jgi:hypothetical protein
MRFQNIDDCQLMIDDWAGPGRRLFLVGTYSK